ncbi:MAG TPA: ATP-binding protein [Azospirillaceae bacterium]|nr:ATP-binding protein [Azospirillaceae bacterium]
MIPITVTDQSQVSDARRRVGALARGAGFDETEAGKVAIVVTELATNLLRHGGGGEILASVDSTDGGLAVLALDKGPGMASVEACLRDGFSTGGTQGTGFGAIRRQSRAMDVWSKPGSGTAILCRFGGSEPPADGLRVGGVCVPMPGEEASGDGWSCSGTGSGARTILVADGLGHGPQAATAALEAGRLFLRRPDDPVPTILETLHHGLRATRGAAVAVARVEPALRRVAFGGVGNIAGTVFAAGQHKKTVSHTGTAGVSARRFQEFVYPIDGDWLLVMHSDGVSGGWSLDSYPGLAMRDPLLVAGVLYRDFSRRRDDSTVVVARGRTP